MLLMRQMVNKEFCGTAPFIVHAFTMFTDWTVRNSTKIRSNFFLPPVKSNHNISWPHPCKMNIKFATEITCQTSVHAK